MKSSKNKITVRIVVLQIFREIKQDTQKLAKWLIQNTTPIAISLLEWLEKGFDSLIENILPKDHSLQGGWEKESTILSRSNSGFNLTGKSTTDELSSQGVLINGGSGSGKTSVSLVKSILTVQGMQMIHDPSKELIRLTGHVLSHRGTQVIPIDWKDRFNTFFFNPLKRANSLSEITKLASQLVELVNAKGKKDYWNQSAIAVLVVMIRIAKLLDKEYQNLFTVAHLLDLVSTPYTQNEITKLVAILTLEDEGLYEKYMSLINSGESFQGVLASAKIAVQAFALDEHLAVITSRDNLGDFRALRQENQKAIFIHSSTTGASYYKGISSIFFYQYFQSFFSEMPDKKKDHSVYFHLDEAPLLTLELDVVSANCRKYSGNLMVVCQDAENQLSTQYGPEKARSILANLRTKLFLSTSLTAAEKLVKELGRYEYTDKKTGHKKQRALMTIDEIMSLPEDRGLITVVGKRPILAKLTPYYKIPKFKKLTQTEFEFSTDNKDHSLLVPPLFFDPKIYVENWKETNGLDRPVASENNTNNK